MEEHHYLTGIEPSHIERLDPDKLVKLLHFLLHCEAFKRSILNHGILVPFQINVPDGGRDAQWNHEIEDYEYIPRSKTYYQAKASNLTIGKCKAELITEDSANKGQLIPKPRVKEVLESGGCYAFFTTSLDFTDDQEKDIESVAEEAFKKTNFTRHPESKVVFFGRNKIHDWVNRHPSAIVYTRKLLGEVRQHDFMLLDDVGREFAEDGAFFSNESLDRIQRDIRDALIQQDRCDIRITGLSGIGKTRLVYEALKSDNNASSERSQIASSTIFYSNKGGERLSPHFVSSLARNNYTLTLIVDDCDARQHSDLKRLIASAPINLITTFYEKDEPPLDTLHIELSSEHQEGTPEKIIRADSNLLMLGETAIKQLSNYCENLPKIAHLIKQMRKLPNVEALDREHLLTRLIGPNSEDANSPEYQITTAFSLFMKIGGSQEALTKHKKSIRDILTHQIDAVPFSRVYNSQMRRGIIQQVADTAMLGPRPLAVALCSRFVRDYPEDKFKDLVDQFEAAGLLSQFADRIAEIELSDQSETLGEMLLERLPFHEADYLLSGPSGARIFRSVCMLNPKAAVNRIQAAFVVTSNEDLAAARKPRRNLVNAVTALCWPKETFHKAAPLLLRLAASENENWANNATGEFVQLYHLSLSGTQLPALDRLQVIDEALANGDKEQAKIAIRALGAGLQMGSFSRMSNTTVGGKCDSEHDWHPTTYGDMFDYWKAIFQRLNDLILSRSEHRDLAIKVLGNRPMAFIRTQLIDDLDEDFKNLFDCLNNLWPDFKSAIKSQLNHREKIPDNHRKSLQRWLGYLTPKAESVRERIIDLVSKPGWEHVTDESGKYIDIQSQRAKELARDLISITAPMADVIPVLLTGEQRQGFTFGLTLGEEHPASGKILNTALSEWTKTPEKERNSSFISGLVNGIGKNSQRRRQEILDHIASDNELIDLLIPSSSFAELFKNEDLIRVCTEVVNGRIPAHNLRGLIGGLPLLKADKPVIIRTLADTLKHNPEAADSLLDICASYIFHSDGLFLEMKDILTSLVVHDKITLNGGHLEWEWSEICKRLLKESKSSEFAELLTDFLVNRALADHLYEYYIPDVIQAALSLYPEETWKIVSQNIENLKDYKVYRLLSFFSNSSPGFDVHPSPIWSLREDIYKSWVNSNPDFAKILLSKMQLFSAYDDQGQPKTREEESAYYEWHPYALIIMEAISAEDAIHSLHINLWSYGSTGSRIPYIKKRKALVETLNKQDNPKMKKIASQICQQLEQDMKSQERHEINECQMMH